MPSPVFALKGKKTDPGVTNIRDTKSAHWHRCLSVEHHCLEAVAMWKLFIIGECLLCMSHPNVSLISNRIVQVSAT